VERARLRAMPAGSRPVRTIVALRPSARRLMTFQRSAGGVQVWAAACPADKDGT